MRLSFGQEMRMAQKQILAPRMIQSMEILQLPIMALQERIEQEIQENPCLDVQESDLDLPEETAEVERPDAPTLEEREMVVDETKDNKDDFERLVEMDREYPDQYDERSRISSQRTEDSSDRQHDVIANMADRPQTLHDYLHEQLSWHQPSEALRTMCDRIIYNLDPSGYLQGPLQDLLDADAGPEQLKLAQEALALIQRLDPPGIAARDLRECLLLQLKPGMPFYLELHKLISNHLEDLEHNRLPVIQKKTNYSLDLIQTVLEELRHLNPKPGANYTVAMAPTVTPDVFLEQDDQGNYTVRLEDAQLPNLYISTYYRQRLQSGNASPEEKEYIRRKINAAQWLIESIEQRRSTLTRVAQAIVEHQKEFLNKGPEFIEPLKMQQIADVVKVHVTTVSRAVDEKWMQTPRGLFPLKKFFVGGTMSSDGEEVAWDAVRLKLQEIVEKEDKRAPLSDDDLVVALKLQNITVARRTVTKYRKSMNIPSSRQRRDWALGDAPLANSLASSHSETAENSAAPEDNHDDE